MPHAARPDARALGLSLGVLPPGPLNAITDVRGVRVGHVTLIAGDCVRTGVTAIVPADGNLFQQKLPAALYVGNGFGKLAGATQLDELGTLETPIVLTNTLAVAAAIDALVTHALAQPGNEAVRSVNAVVGETNDGELNDIRARPVRPEHVLEAIARAADGPIEQGSVGAGTGIISFGYKAGIGTASRALPAKLGGYTVGVLAQANFGGVLTIDGVPVGRELGRYSFRDEINSGADVDGSCVLVVATDAPLDARQLRRLAKRAFMGLARTGGIASNGSGDYAIAFSTQNRVPHAAPAGAERAVRTIADDACSPLFLAAIEAAEEAIINSLFTARSMTGVGGREVDALPVDRVLELLARYGRTRT